MKPEEKWWSKSTIEILRLIIVKSPITKTELAKVVHGKLNRVDDAIKRLVKAGFPIKHKTISFGSRHSKRGKSICLYWI
jgi:chromosome segregation and condensation protein ScpB